MLKSVLKIHTSNAEEIDLTSAVDYQPLFNADENTLYWIDIAASSPQEWSTELSLLGLNSTENSICSDDRPFPKVEPLKDGLYLHLPASNKWDEESHYIHILLHKNILITHTKADTNPLDKSWQNIRSGARPEGEESIFLLMLILDGLTESLVGNHLIARTMINDYIKGLSQIPKEDDNDMVVELKELLAIIAGQCEENLFSCALLRTLLNRPSIPNSARNILNDILDTLNHVQKSMTRLDQRLEDQLLRIDSHLREQTDKRLRILTVISSIFMPITFISSVYGMNFHYMPELSLHWAYPICLLIMAVLAIGMTVFFAVKGWFR